MTIPGEIKLGKSFACAKFLVSGYTIRETRQLKKLNKASKSCGYGRLILISKQWVENKNLLQSFNSFNFNDTHKEKLCLTQFSTKIY